ncbi:MAG: hypothetical protein PVH84_16655 [Candidatus Aminicenantes bacterium]
MDIFKINDRGENMRIKDRELLLVLIVLTLVSSGFGTKLVAGEETIANNEVRVFLQSDFKGPFLSWKLEPGMRQRFIHNVGDAWKARIVSIQMGTDVAIMLFQKENFRFAGSAYTNLSASVNNISFSLPGAENKYSSLIIYPKTQGNPLGILAGNSETSDFRFFPLPENKDENRQDLADIRHLMSPIDFILLFPGKGPDSAVSATLYSEIRLSGHSIKLPLKARKTRYNLIDLNFAGRAKSLRIEQTTRSAQLQNAQDTASQKIIRKTVPSSAIKVQSVAGTCAISGTAKGMHTERASLYSVVLYGPNDFTIKTGVARFDSKGRFLFSSLPEGRYKIVISPDPGKADMGSVPKPPKQSGSIIECKSGETKHIDIFFD